MKINHNLGPAYVQKEFKIREFGTVVILGENASGKSVLTHAIQIALAKKVLDIGTRASAASKTLLADLVQGKDDPRATVAFPNDPIEYTLVDFGEMRSMLSGEGPSLAAFLRPCLPELAVPQALYATAQARKSTIDGRIRARLALGLPAEKEDASRAKTAKLEADAAKRALVTALVAAWNANPVLAQLRLAPRDGGGVCLMSPFGSPAMSGAEVVWALCLLARFTCPGPLLICVPDLSLSWATVASLAEVVGEHPGVLLVVSKACSLGEAAEFEKMFGGIVDILVCPGAPADA